MKKCINQTKTNNEIIEELFKKKIFNKLSVSFNLNEFDRDDLMSIVIIYMLELDNEKLNRLYNEKKLISFIKKTLYNQYISKNTKFYKEIIQLNKISTELIINNNLIDEDNNND